MSNNSYLLFRKVRAWVQADPEDSAEREEQAGHHRQQHPAPPQVRDRVLRHAGQDRRPPLRRGQQ